MVGFDTLIKSIDTIVTSNNYSAREMQSQKQCA